MKIVLATPIYPPEIGGPAIYAKKLREGLQESGNSIEVVSYQGLKKYPQPLRIFFYFLRLFMASRNCDLIYALSLMSCALPAYFCRKKLAIRIGGDYLWERAVEEGKTDKSLREYYKGLPRGFRARIIEKILKNADKLIFTSRFQKDIYLEYFGIDERKTAIILNPFPVITPSYQLPVASYQLLYAGRFIKLKNLSRLIEAFKEVAAEANKPVVLKFIGKGPEEKRLRAESQEAGDRIIFEGPVSHDDLLEEIKKSRFCILPSLSEITPNFALECIKLEKPVLLTKETGFYDIFKDNLIFINPFDVEDIKNKIEFLLDDNNLQSCIKKISRIDKSRGWKTVIDENIKILEIT